VRSRSRRFVSAAHKLNDSGMMPGQIVEVLNGDPENLDIVVAKSAIEFTRKAEALKKQHPNAPATTPTGKSLTAKEH
jgi:hypothetical protein